ncbi:hypothetical protein MM300_22520 [Evansella sp. LMS18]|uniref:hypothetical protein n=1 Tax=Evansella sp. LMS18 TaxID=2924033 RepID=UPI0020D08085|nr:hypothetical protein [Evansella sp. LMS18]UTR10603.1 hypothetical protein MM300_22520 [Evansella sp. LMS18]
MGNNQKNNKGDIKQNVNAALGGMGLYGTTGNTEIEGYEMSGDIENAGRLDKGFKRDAGTEGASASIEQDDD